MHSLKPIRIVALLCALALATSCKKQYITNNPANVPPAVDAGTVQTTTLPVDTVTLTGSVTDAKSLVVSYLWSEVSGPNVPVIASEGSLTTIVRGLTTGTYLFQLMATDTFGLTGVDTVSVIVLPPVTVTLQPTNSTNEFDYLGTGSFDGSPGAQSAELGAETWTEGGNTVFLRFAIKFDLAGLATNVKSAKLTLYSNPSPQTANLTTPNAGPTNSMFIQRINQDWNSASTNWPTQPTTDVTGEVSIPHTDQPSLDLVDIDVTDLVKTMMASGNYGFMVRLQNEVLYNSRIFCSSKFSDATKHPKLVINY